jgi:hypothetical protein
MSQDTQQPKWTVERVRQEIYDARTKMFTMTKVLEAGTIDWAEHPEWVLVIRPLLKDVVDNAQKISAMLEAGEDRK